MLAVPLTKKVKTFDCGTACAKAVLAFWELKYPRVSAAGWPSPIDGTDPRVLEALLRKSGLQVVAGEFTVGMVRDRLRAMWPVICLVQEDGGGHYVVAVKVARGRVWYMDPEDGRYHSQPVADFVARWRAGDVCRTGFPYYQWGVAAGVELTNQ